jgi:hypothetical protein
LPVGNQMPMSAAFLDFRPVAAHPAGRGVVVGRLSYHVANMVMWEAEDGVAMRMDLEAHNLLVDVTWGLTERATLRLGGGYRWHVGGVLDGFIADFEAAAGLPTPWSRRHSEEGDTRWWIRREEETLFDRPDPAHGVADLVVGLDWQVGRQRGWRPAAALRLAAKLPLAPTGEGLGTGGLDGGVGLVVSWEYGPFATHLNLDSAWLADHDGLQGTPFEETGTLRTVNLSQVVALRERWEAALQVEVRSNPYETRIESMVEEVSAEIHLGLRRHLAGGGSWVLAITENALDKASPDFGILVGVELRLAGGASLQGR